MGGLKSQNKLTILYNSRKDDRRKQYVMCLCECGNIKELRLDHIKSGRIKSCGCLGKTQLLSHGLSRTRLYRIYIGMKQRCYNENHNSYKRYGGRGITVCDEWKNDFVEFKNWALNNGYYDELTLDRINNNGNYEPSNCRWVTLLEQANNKSNNRYITYDGETKTYSEWCRIKNYNRRLIQERINVYHWSEKDALLIKPRARRLSNKWED